MDRDNLSGKTAVVLGASTSYGGAICKRLADRGVNLALGGRSRNELETLQGEISASGGEALVVGMHLAKHHHAAHLVEAALEHYGSLDILLFMAHASAAPLDSLDLGAWERSIDVNIKGFVYCLAASLPALREDGGGRVVVLNVEDPAGAPDPFLRAGQAATRTILEEVHDETLERRVLATEVRSDARALEDPERCAEKVVQALDSLPDPDAGFLTYQV